MTNWTGDGSTAPAGTSTGYTSLVEAEEFSLRVADITAWTDATTDAQSRALTQASDEIDTLRYAGRKYEEDQDRAFPRFIADDPSEWPSGKANPSGKTVDLDDDDEPVAPEPVKFACFLQALDLLKNPCRQNRQEDRHDGVTAQSAAGVSESYDTSLAARVVCLKAHNILTPYLLKGGRIY